MRGSAGDIKSDKGSYIFADYGIRTLEQNVVKESENEI